MRTRRREIMVGVVLLLGATVAVLGTWFLKGADWQFPVAFTDVDPTAMPITLDLSAMMLGSKAYSMMFVEGADYAMGSGLAHVAIPALRHRINLRFDWKTGYRKLATANDGNMGFLDQMLRDFCLATAPKDNEYLRTFKVALDEALTWDTCGDGGIA